MDKIFDKTYNVGGNQIRVRLKYNLLFTSHELDMDVLELGKLEFGYEDEDQLTFYPNVFTLEFDDYERKNYYTLKYAFGETPLHNFESNHSGEIYYNGNRIFEGYIDKNTLQYDETNRHIVFDMVDYTVQLRQKGTGGLGPQDWAGGITDIIRIYRQVYPNLNFNVTQDINEYRSNSFNGAYFSHNWVFKGNGTSGVPQFDVSWASADGWDHVHIFRQRLWESGTVLSDILKAYAREFGMTIGSGGVNKIYIVKRFVNANTVTARRIDSSLKDYRNEIWLSNVMGVRNIPANNPDPPTNVQIEGYFETVDGTLHGAPRNKDNVIDMRTTLSRQQGTGNTGVANIRVSQGVHVQTVLNGIYDPDFIPHAYRPIESMITRHTMLSRLKPRDKWDLELTGIDYYMHEFYSARLAGVPPVTLRPIQISIDLVNESTTMQALEVGL